MKRNPLVVALVVLCGVIAALFVGRFVMPHTPIASVLTDHVLIMVGGWTKLASLLLATAFAFRSAALLGRDNASFRSWAVLGAGLATFSLGQATLSAYQTFTGVSPFPSFADVWFMLAYPLLIIALIMFIVAYVRGGFSLRGLPVMAAGVFIAAAVIAWPLLAPIARTPASLPVRVLNVAYPALDLLLLVPAVVLLAITVRFRGGAVWHIWAGVLAGVVFTVMGDIGYAWFSAMGASNLDPLVHAIYISSYCSIAIGTAAQYRLVAPERATVQLATA